MTDLFLGAHVPEDLTAVTTALGPAPDDTIVEMEQFARAEGFPIVGRAVGGWLAQLARLVGASRVFEFGSGFGYSAYWFARALPADGTVVLTDADERNMERAREFFQQGDVQVGAQFEGGDAIETARDYDGPFDVALLDIEKYEYTEAFDVIREKLPSGGVVVADNVLTAGREAVDDTVAYEPLRAVLTGEADSLDGTDIGEPARRGTAGILEYLKHVREQPEFETTLLPLGDGVTVTARTR